MLSGFRSNALFLKRILLFSRRNRTAASAMNPLIFRPLRKPSRFSNIKLSMKWDDKPRSMPRRFSVFVDRKELGRHPFRVMIPLTILVFLSAGSLYYWRSNSIRLTMDGHTRRIFTKAHTLREFFDEQHISLGPMDFATPPPDTPIGSKTAAKITRVTVETRTDTYTETPKVTWQNRTREN